MLKRYAATAAFTLLAGSALAAAPMDMDDPLGLQMRQIAQRSDKECDASRDVSDSAAKRAALLTSLRDNPDDMLPSVRLLGLANSGKLALCFDKTMASTPHKAVVYVMPGYIALAPDASKADLQAALGTFAGRVEAVNSGKIDDNEWAKAVGVGAQADKPLPAPFREARLQ